jgi:hypothetical protein
MSNQRFLGGSIMKNLTAMLLLCSSLSAATLNVRAGLVYVNSGPQYVARTRFYILNESAEKIIKQSGLSPNPTLGLLGYYALYHLDRTEKDSPDERFEKGTQAITAHVVASGMTDFDGRAGFKLPEGEYYLFGYASTRDDGIAVWNLKVQVRANTSVILDQNNAVQAF